MSSMYPFERFTQQSKGALTQAQVEAERSGKSYIGTEHLLLALFQVEGAMAPQILADLGVELDSARTMIDSILGQNDERIAIQQIVPTSRVKRVIEIAFEEGRRMSESSVGTHHLLLGLTIEGEGIAGHVLGDLGVTEGRVRDAIARVSAAGVREDAAPGGPPARPTGGPTHGPDPQRMARGLDDLTAVELLAALQERFGTAQPPPPDLLELAGRLREARRQEEAAAAAKDYERAGRYRDEGRRLQAEATARLDAWRHDQG